jgi:predicted phosphoadenosine phosphosulfate sulfurtransferase
VNGRGRAGQTGLEKPLQVQYVHPTLDVFAAAQQRVAWVFDEFEGRVAVSSSGGKDSTVVLELAAAEARKRGLPPVPVAWLDQECEFESTVEYQRRTAARPDVEFLWYQVPFRLFNSTDSTTPWLHVWDETLAPPAPGEPSGWVREKEPGNPLVHALGRADRFKDCLDEISFRHVEHFDGKPTALLTGIRAEESPARRLAVTSNPGYKFVTWSAHRGGCPYTMFQPIYDWRLGDVWHAIHSQGWSYNRHYDNMFRFGVSPRNMRVSNYHHETAIHALAYLQEVEPATYEAATARLSGIATFARLGRDQFPHKLPYMFGDWVEYLHYLIDNLATCDEHRATFRAQWETLRNTCLYEPVERLAKVLIYGVITYDLYGTKMRMFMAAPQRLHQSVGVVPRSLEVAEATP